jgi:hypothetical protein
VFEKITEKILQGIVDGEIDPLNEVIYYYIATIYLIIKDFWNQSGCLHNTQIVGWECG